MIQESKKNLLSNNVLCDSKEGKEMSQKKRKKKGEKEVKGHGSGGDGQAELAA